MKAPSPSGPPRIGVRGWPSPEHATLLNQIQVCELDFQSLKNAKRVARAADARDIELILSCGPAAWRKEDPREVLAALAESCETLGAVACVLRLGVRETWDASAWIALRQGEWRELSSPPLLFEGPAEFRFSPGGNSSAQVIDPMWERPRRGLYWKVHGWHDARWVRRYSEEQLGTLAKAVLRFTPRWVILAHSQRMEQVGKLDLAIKA